MTTASGSSLRTSYYIKSLVFVVGLTLCTNLVLGGSRSRRIQFDFNDYVENNRPPERNSGLTPRGVVVRQAINPVPILQQFIATKIDRVTCDFSRRVWKVSWSVVVQDNGLGVPFSTVYGRCNADRDLQFDLSPVADSGEAVLDGGVIKASQLLALSSPEADEFSQIVFACTFQLKGQFQNTNAVAAQVLDNYAHYCRESDLTTINGTNGTESTDACDFGPTGLPCLFNTGLYPGYAIFYYMIYSIVIAFAVFSWALLFCIFQIRTTDDLANIDRMNERRNSSIARSSVGGSGDLPASVAAAAGVGAGSIYAQSLDRRIDELSRQEARLQNELRKRSVGSGVGEEGMVSYGDVGGDMRTPGMMRGEGMGGMDYSLQSPSSLAYSPQRPTVPMRSGANYSQYQPQQPTMFTGGKATTAVEMEDLGADGGGGNGRRSQVNGRGSGQTGRGNVRRKAVNDEFDPQMITQVEVKE